MRHRLPAAVAALALAGSAAVALAPTATATARPASHRPSPAGAPSWLVAHGEHPSNARAAGQAAAPAPAAPTHGLDPAAAAQPAAANGTVRVAVGGAADAVRTQVQARGGRVLVSANGTSVAVLPKSQLLSLSRAAGVTSVGTVDRPYTMSTPSPVPPGPSQAVAASNADQWAGAGFTGSGVKLAIIDAGFGDNQAQYDGEVSAGHLGANTQIVNEDCTDANNTPTPYDGVAHGLAVAEVAQQQAPNAQLYLYCINSATGMATAEAAVEAAGIKLISSSLGWYNDARGDGTAGAGSAAAIAKRARQHGILWINSAGNTVPQHWSGSLADVDKDGYLDIGNHVENTYPFESDFFYTAPGSPSAPTSMAFFFQWDNWPTTGYQVTLQAYGVQCTADFSPTNTGLDGCSGYWLNNQNPIGRASTKGGSPTVELDTSGFPNTSQYPQVWQVLVKFDGAYAKGAHYDLYADGDTYYASDLACAPNTSGNCTWAAAARQDSVISPANSPYVLATGAADVGADGTTKGTLEYFSSQGPTIDGRVKPDITGWDGLSSYVSDFDTGFYGTSAAAPTVAGAAALVAQANPALDAAQLQSFLEQRANSGAPNNPPTNTLGHGLLTLGAASNVDPPVATNYAPITPQRILDTRTPIGGHQSPLGPDSTLTVTVPGLPGDATAVAINLTGVGATGNTFLSVYPGGSAFPGTSNLNLSKTDPTAAVFAIVPVHNGQLTVLNNSATVNVIVDELGYFGTGAETGRYTPLAAPKRVLDTRGSLGGSPGQLTTGKSVMVHPALPGATAAIVNITTTGTTSSGELTAAARCTGTTSTLNYWRYTRANLAIVPLDPDGNFCITAGGGPAQVIVDVLGSIGATGAQYVALPTGQRIVDTRTGNGGSAGGRASKPFGPGTTTAFYGSNVGDVPAAATALLTGVVETSNTAGGYLSLFPGASKPASMTSSFNFTPGRIVSNAAVVGLASRDFAIFNAAGSTNAAVDLFGYFI
ncbi:MAG TPA: S8 family serine peptidase [Jatrophihabitans sp.]|nr:S8 family serine peptidase [Jatrophihabitans sp.]